MVESGLNSKARFKLDYEFSKFFEEDNIEEVISVKSNISDNLLDVTNFNNNGWVNKIKGLKEITGSIGFYLKNNIISIGETGQSGIFNLALFNSENKNGYLEIKINDYIVLGLEIQINNIKIDTRVTETKIVSVEFTNKNDFVYLYEIYRTNNELENIENYILMNLSNYEIQYINF